LFLSSIGEKVSRPVLETNSFGGGFGELPLPIELANWNRTSQRIFAKGNRSSFAL
jgi:hypothetical protein